MPSSSLIAVSLKKIKTGYFAVVFFSFCINLLLLSVPLYMLQIYDRVLSSRSLDTLLFLSLITGLAILTLGCLEFIRGGLAIKLGAWLDRQLSVPALERALVLPLHSGMTPSAQSLRDVSSLRSFLSSNELFCFFDAPWTPVFLLFVFLLHPYLGYLALGGTLLLFALAVLNEWMTRPLLSHAGKAQMAGFHQAESAVRNADVLHALGMAGNLARRWERIQESVLDVTCRAGSRGTAFLAASKFLRQVLQISMLGVGAWLVIKGELTPGAMIAGSILMARALAPVEQAISSWKSAVSARSALQRLRLHFDALPEAPASMALPPPEGELAVEGLSYFHPGKTEPVLKGLNFTVRAGEMLGIIGPSGSGKTTLGRLLLGNLTPRLGHVRLDGVDLAKWNREEVGPYCGYLPQDIELFVGTIRENIARMGEGGDAEVLEAARLAGCHDMVVRLPEGYETQVGDGGVGLSGGERQRIGLARALYGNPRLVVLDEPNSSLDAAGEAALLNALKQLKQKGVTVVLIGHRPNIVQFADKLLVLVNGQVQDFGPREAVLRKLSAGNPESPPPVRQPA